jgi:porin
MQKIALTAIASLAGYHLLAQTVVTNAPTVSWWEQDTLTGNWGGLRIKANDLGFTPGVEYTGEAWGNTSGGRRQAALYQGLLKVQLDFDPEKTTGWRGAQLHVSGLWIEGSEPNATGDIAGLTGSRYSDPSNISAYDTIRLFELWLEQRFWDGKLAVKFGQISLDEEFICNDYAGVFISGTHGWPAFVANTLLDGGQAYPLSGTGFRLAYKASDAVDLRAAVMDGDVHNQATDNRHGTHFGFHADEGVLSMVEIGWHRHQQPGDTELPGCYKIGGWFHTGDFSDPHWDTLGRSLTDDGTLSGLPTTGVAAKHSGNGGFYLDICQMIWRSKPDTDQGVGFYARLAPWLSSNRNPIDFYAAAGLHCKGVLPTRENDVLGIGCNYARVSSSLRELQKDANRIAAAGGTPNEVTSGPVPDCELGLEITYQANLSPWWTVQPDFQYVFHPGGSAALGDAIVVGLRTTVIF